jgi:hypothetical protein
LNKPTRGHAAGIGFTQNPRSKMLYRNIHALLRAFSPEEALKYCGKHLSATLSINPDPFVLSPRLRGGRLCRSIFTLNEIKHLAAMPFDKLRANGG